MATQVRSRRKHLGWTRRDLSARTGISERFLADVEAGRANPSVSKLVDLAGALGCDPGELIATKERWPVVALLGLRGAGKSTLGEALGYAYSCPFVELDNLIENHTGITLSEIFQLHGESYYRRAEQEVLRQILEAAQPVVLACGGGLVTDAATFAYLRSRSHTVWLRATPEDHWRRVIDQGDMRPMANNDQAFADLCSILSEREALYRQCELTIDTSAEDVAASVRSVTRQFGPPPKAGVA